MSASANHPDDRTIGAGTDWLAQVSVAARGLAANQGHERLRSTTRLPNESRLAGSPISVDPARDRFLHFEVAPTPLLPLQTRSGLLLVGFIGFLLSVALTAVVMIPQFRHADKSFLDRGIERGSWAGPLPPAILATRDDLSIPHLIVHPSRVMAGEPAPLGVAVEGRAENAVVTIVGLMPGMELSTGSAVGGDAWKLQATDLPYAWIAPPDGFVGVATVVVELRLSHDRIIDRQVIQLEWTTAIFDHARSAELNREETAQVQPDRQEINEVPAISPAVAQPSLNQEYIIEVLATPPAEQTVTEPAQQVTSEEVRKDNFGTVRPSAKDRLGGLSSAPARVGDNPRALKGFWDWSQ